MSSLKRKSQAEEDSNPVEGSEGTGFAWRFRKALSHHRSPNKRRKKSSARAPMTKRASTFGMPLDTLVVHHESPTMSNTSLTEATTTGADSHHEVVPLIVSRIVKHVERNGLSCEGIYRISGNAKVMEKIRDEFDRFGVAKLDQCDIYSVGGTLKLFLRQLPDPIIPDDKVHEMIQVQKAKGGGRLTKEGIIKLQELISQIPRDNYNLLKFLLRHLLLVSTFAAQNKMTIMALAIVFGPNIFRCGGDLDGLRLQGDTNAVLAQMLFSYTELFEDVDEGSPADSDVSDEVFEGSATEGTIEALRERRRSQKKEKPVKIRPYSQQVNDGGQPPVSGSTSKSALTEMDDRTVSLLRRRAQSEPSSTVGERRSETELRLCILEEEGNIQVQRTPSPCSWKSSPGASPPTSPAMTPRSSNVYSNLISDSIQHNLFQSPSPTLQPATATTTSGLASLSRQPDSLTDTHPAPKECMEGLTGTDHEQTSPKQEGSTDLSENILKETDDVHLRGSSKRRERSHRVCSVYEGVFSDSKTLGRNFRPTLSNFSDDEDELSIPFSSIETPTFLTSRFDSPRIRKSSTMRERSYSAGPEVGRVRVKTIVDTFERSRKLIMPFDSKTNSPAPKKEPLPPFLEEDSSSSSPEPVVTAETPKPMTEQPLPTSVVESSKSPKDSIPKSESLHAEGTEQKSYVTRTTGSLYHPTLKRVAGPPNRRKPQRKSVHLPVHHENPPPAGKKNPDEPHVSTTTEVKREAGTSPRLNRARGKIKQLIKAVQNPPSLTALSTNLLHNTDNVDSSVTSKKASEEGTGSDLPVVRLTESGNQSRENVAPESADKVQKGWEDKVNVAQRSVSKDRKSEQSKQAQRRPVRGKVKEQHKKGLDPMRTSEEAEKVSQTGDSHSLSVSVNELAITLSSEEPITAKKKQGQRRHVSSSSLSSMNDQKLLNPSMDAKIQRHRSLDLLKVEPIVRRKGSRQSQSKTTLTPVAVVMEKIQNRLSEKRTEAGRPLDLTKMSAEELEEEKHCIQKALLQFEKKFGRPQTHEDKAVMRPLYTRYRIVKQLLAREDSKARSTIEGLGSTTADTLPSVTMMNLSMQKLPSPSLRMEAPTRGIYSQVPSKDLTKQEWLSPETISKSMSRSELAEELAVTMGRKKEVKELLRKFESEFESVHGRTCTREDKLFMYNDYQEYKSLKCRLNTLETALQKMSPQATM